MVHYCHRRYQHYVLGLLPISRFRRKRFTPFFLRHGPVRCRCMVVLDWGVTGCLCKLLVQKKLLVIWSDGVDCYVSNTEGVVEILEKRCSTISVESWASGRNKERGRTGVMVFCGSARTRTPRGYGEFESDSIIQSSWNLIHSAKHEPSYKIDRQHSSTGQPPLLSVSIYTVISLTCVLLLALYRPLLK